MIEDRLSLTDPIAALATPWGKSAVAVIRTSGDGAIALADSLFSGRRRLADRGGHTLTRGRLVDPEKGEAIDEVLAAVFRAPSSYTGEDSVEWYLHGGLPTVARALGLLRAHGFRDAAPGEFSLRAFRNGKLDLTAAEAVNDIVNAQSDRARSLALSRLSGAVAGRIEGVKRRLVETLAGVEAMIDYPDEIDEHPENSRDRLLAAGADLDALILSYRAGRVFQEGATAAVAGRPNAGKSTLFNLLLREDRSIVSDRPGTTRDFIEGAITVAGIPIRLFDTAGLRAAAEPLEEEGVRRTRRVLGGADLIVYLVDAAAGLAPEDEAFLAGTGRPVIRVWNKIDIASGPAPAGFIPVSAVDGRGFAELEAAVARTLLGEAPAGAQEALIDSPRQKEALESARAAIARAASGAGRNVSPDLLAADLREAVDQLGRITGEVSSADILEIVFSKFCLGK